MVKNITGQTGDDEFAASLSGQPAQSSSQAPTNQQAPTSYTPSINNAQPVGQMHQSQDQDQHTTQQHMHDVPPAPQTGGYPPAQGQLDVTVQQPNPPKTISDVDLEIPAFLRRQAN
jgi:cell division protein FtsZ